MRKVFRYALLLGTFIAGQATAANAANVTDAQTLDDLVTTGPDIPTYGHSLFDALLATVPESADGAFKVPYPFSALLAHIRTELGWESVSDSELFDAVLIPIGRSLQRNTAAPQYFHSPRIVVAVRGESADPNAPLLKDRLYLGYQPQSGVIEIISYNEAMGRFEFQIVKDYREHASPQLYYAPRMICMACHQNQAPIFSRPLWRETNANPKIAAELLKLNKDFHSIPVKRGIDIPAAIDAATDRANGFALSQQLWREGCAQLASAQDCRASLLNAMLQLRLSGGRGYADDGPLRLDEIRSAWQVHWPAGLVTPNPDLPDRDPLAADADSASEEVRVAAAADPLLLRPPLAPQRFDEEASMRAVVKGLAEFMGEADIQHIDRLLTKSPVRHEAQQYDATCQYRIKAVAGNEQRVDVRCASNEIESPALDLEARLYFQNGSYQRGVIDRLHLLREDFADIRLEVDAGQGGKSPDVTLRPRWQDRNLRYMNGALISALRLAGASARQVDANDVGSLQLEVRGDYAQVKNHLHNADAGLDENMDLALSDQPLRRELVTEALFTLLDKRPAQAREDRQRNLPPPRLEYQPGFADVQGPDVHAPDTRGPDARGTDAHVAEGLGTLRRYCAACHDSAETFPPNFLSGDAASVESKLRHCADRINYRLAMWTIGAADRTKSPMPPASALSSFGKTPEQWLSGAELQRIQQYVQGLATEPATSRVRAGGAYEQLQRCLPEGG